MNPSPASLVMFIPLGLLSGVWAGGRKGQPSDNRFRTAAFVATSLPPFVLALVLLQAAMTFIHTGGGSVWGDLLVSGRDWIIGQSGNPLTYWWVFVPASLALIRFGAGWSLIGDGLNDLINPHKQIE